MTLGDAVIDEYSRHVLLPEIGPAGQARLLATRVRVAGEGPGRPLLAGLLARSGLAVVDAGGDVAAFLGAVPDVDAPRPSVACWGGDDVLHVRTLVGRPCPACAAPPPTWLPASPLGVQTLATLAATVLVLRIVSPAAGSTDVRFDLASGRLETEPLAGAGCDRCAAVDRDAR